MRHMKACPTLRSFYGGTSTKPLCSSNKRRSPLFTNTLITFPAMQSTGADSWNVWLEEVTTEPAWGCV